MSGRTVSALPDCLAAHRTGTLSQLEATLLALENADSLSAATATTRTDIELPGALRYLSRLRRDIHAALTTICGLYPEDFVGVAPTITAFAAFLGVTNVLVHLRGEYVRYLPQLPAPVGFDPRRGARDNGVNLYQHPSGRDPPQRVFEAHVLVLTQAPATP